MPKITWLKEFDGALWARLELDSPPNDPVHVLTTSEIEEIKRKERQACWDEIKAATCSADFD